MVVVLQTSINIVTKLLKMILYKNKFNHSVFFLKHLCNSNSAILH